MPNKVEDRQGTNHSASLRLLVLADDLTGACDAAAPFAMRGLHTEVGVVRNASPSPACDVWSCSTESRDGNPASVELTLARCLSKFSPTAMLFKKVDSVFRGNTVAEVAAVRRLRPHGVALLAPAFPQAGRIVRNGTLEVCDAAGTRTLPLAAMLRAHGLDVRQLAASNIAAQLRLEMEDHPASVATVLLCDAESQEHLDALVEVASDALVDPLWIGSAGLAHALAKSLAPIVLRDPEVDIAAEVEKTVLMFIGSTHAVTCAQVKALDLQREQHQHVQIVEVPRGPSAREYVLDAVWGLRREQIGALFVTGGDTASLVFAALGIPSLRVIDEFAPGLPRCRVSGGTFDGVPVLLKSGGFGDSTVLCDIAERYRAVPATAGRSSL